MSVLKATTAALLASVFSVPFAFSVQAADLVLVPEPMAEQDVDLALPAVSGPNGKLELSAGGITDPDNALFRAGGSLTLPIGDMFGVQGDVGLENVGGDWAGGGALHLFTRDPSLYLVGVTAGVVVADGSMLAAVGPEAELYLDQVSLEAWAGWAALEYDDVLLPDDDGFFALADLAYYATDDWRISIGAASILGTESLKLATEYQFTHFGLPFSGTGEFRAYDTGSYSIKVGIKGYFGADPDKSLIDRHRQDDPPNRVIDLFGAAGDLLYEEAEEPDGPQPEDFADNETGCIEAGFFWSFDPEGCFAGPPD